MKFVLSAFSFGKKKKKEVSKLSTNTVIVATKFFQPTLTQTSITITFEENFIPVKIPGTEIREDKTLKSKLKSN